MRVIAGKHKGRRLQSLEGLDTRPTLDRVRESAFDILSPYVSGSRFLDLFSGTGAIGIEAISRGAREVVFCDKNKKAVEVIKSNLRTVGESGQVVFGDSFSEIKTLGKFDVVYLDPPYALDITPVFSVDFLKDDGVMIYEHASADKISVPDNFEVIKERKYGTATLSVIRKKI